MPAKKHSTKRTKKLSKAKKLNPTKPLEYYKIHMED